MSLGTIADATVIPCAISSTRVLKAIKDRSQAGMISLVISCQKCDRFDSMRGKSQWDPQRVTRSFRNNGWEVDAEGRDARCPDCKKRRRDTSREIPVGRPVTPTPVAEIPAATVQIVSSGADKLGGLSLVPSIGSETMSDGQSAMPEARTQSEPVDAPTQKPPRVVHHKPKICAYKPCGLEFTPTGPKQLYHALECRRGAERALRRVGSSQPEAAQVTPPRGPRAIRTAPGSMAETPRLAAARASQETTVDPQSTAPPQTPEALKAERKMYVLLDDHYLTDERHYAAGWDDARISTESGVALGRVTFVREGLYGKAVDPFLVVLKEDVDATLERLKSERFTLQAMVREIFDRQEKEIRELQARLIARTS